MLFEGFAITALASIASLIRPENPLSEISALRIYSPWIRIFQSSGFVCERARFQLHPFMAKRI